MTITYDPHHPMYLDQADVRIEFARVADVCHGCQRCVALCTSFPTLFEVIDRHDDHDASRLTPAQQDQVVDECFQCGSCVIGCPYAPGRSDLAVDVPRLFIRARAMMQATGQRRGRRRRTTQVLARTRLVGAFAVNASPLVNRVVGASAGAWRRAALEAVTGLSRHRELPTFASHRFSSWFRHRPLQDAGRERGRAVALVPTCMVEYQQGAIGYDLVQVYERNGITVTPVDVDCCGAPLLHDGRHRQFRRVATRNVARLAAEVRAGKDIVVPRPGCASILRNDYPDHAPGPDADLVAAHTRDSADYLMGVHRSSGGGLDTCFTGEVPRTIAYHSPPVRRVHDACEDGVEATSDGAPAGSDLMRLTGADVRVVTHPSGMDAMWALRAENAAIGAALAQRLGAAIAALGADVVAGDCPLANTAIHEQIGVTAVHPLQVLARAYGIPAHPHFPRDGEVTR